MKARRPSRMRAMARRDRRQPQWPISKTKPGNFMLIHGGWHGGWCWERVANILRVRGHRAWTPTNLGVGEKAHLYSPAINLTTHILDIVNLIDELTVS